MSNRTKVTAFVPCRAGSERVVEKNVREFAHPNLSLLAIKIKQLLACNQLDQIVVSTNDPAVVETTEKMAGGSMIPVLIDHRPESLCRASTKTDELITYLPSIITSGAVLWTHVTSPFIDQTFYDQAIQQYVAGLDRFDSLVTAREHRTFFWNDSGAVSYDRQIEKWPRTQTIQPLFEITSGIFLTDIEIVRSMNDRVGKKPFFMRTNFLQSIDIDTPEDFAVASFLWKNLDEIVKLDKNFGEA